MEALLQVRNLQVSYHTYQGTVQAVRGISMDVMPNDTIAIVGESGCGKSVTGKSILQLIQSPGEILSDSEIRFDGRDVLKMDQKELNSFRGGEASIIFQDALAALNPTMTVGNQIMENLMLHRKMKKQEARENAISLLDQVGISDAKNRVKQFPHEFSGGMRQRVMIAIAFACQPRLLIADEPTTALDVTVQAQILRLISEMQQEQGISVIIITHDLGVVASMAKRIYVMYSGLIMESGSSHDIFYEPRHPYTKALLEAVPKLDLKNKQELITIEGTPPDLLHPPVGCAFAPRCQYAMPACRKAMPPLTEFNGGHSASCWLHDSRAPHIEQLNSTQEEGAL